MPWWDTVARGEVPADAPAITAADRDFAAMLTNMTKVVFSRTLPPADDRVVISGDIADELAVLKRRAGKTILLSCGPATLAPLAGTPGLIDEYLIAVHPAAIGAGLAPRPARQPSVRPAQVQAYPVSSQDSAGSHRSSGRNVSTMTASSSK